jgi:hypothetical protein
MVWNASDNNTSRMKEKAIMAILYGNEMLENRSTYEFMSSIAR